MNFETSFAPGNPKDKRDKREKINPATQEKVEGLNRLQKRAQELMAELGIPIEDMNELAAQILKDPSIATLCKDRPNALETISQANMLSDLGKGRNQLITFIYRIREMVQNPETESLSDFLDKYFTKSPKERDEMLDSLKQFGIRKDTTMRQFFDYHTQWSLEIIDEENGAVSSDVRNAVARHHAIEVINIIPGELTLEDKIVIVQDKYDACRIRGGLTHEQAIAWIREKIQANEKFKGDLVFELILKALNKLAPNIEAYKERRRTQRESAA